MNEIAFKRSNRPSACSKPPWASLIGPDQREAVLKAIRAESIALYGYSMDICPKRANCLTKTCPGRSLPWNSPTAKPYLEEMKKTQKMNSSGELILTNCDLCPIVTKCTSTCAQVNDFMNRDKVQEPELIYRETVDNIEVKPELPNIVEVLGSSNIPWDALNKTRIAVIKKYIYENKDFLTISKELGINDSNKVKYEFYRGLTILSEYGTFREFLEKKGGELSKKQKEAINLVYSLNLSIVQAAKVLGVTKQSVSQIINRTIKKYGIKWNQYKNNSVSPNLR